MPGLTRLEAGIALGPWEGLLFRLAPPDLRLSVDGLTLHGQASNNGARVLDIPSGVSRLWLSSPGHKAMSLDLSVLPEIPQPWELKLEPSSGPFSLRAEARTGIQPKSVRFGPEGQRAFVPLLGEPGIDVFRLAEDKLEFEQRLLPPDPVPGFVETWIDPWRMELWASNMEENRIHAWDLETLSYRTSIAVGGLMPKVIVQHPEGGRLYVSNWLSGDISVIDPESATLLHRIPLAATIRGMAFGSDPQVLWVCVYDSPRVVLLDLEQKKRIKEIDFYPGFGAARHIAYHEGFFWISDMGQGRVVRIDEISQEVLASGRIGPNLNSLVLSPEARYVLVSSRGRNNAIDYILPGPDFGAIYLLDSKSLEIKARVWGRNQPTGLDIFQDRLLFTDFLDRNLEYYHFLP